MKQFLETKETDYYQRPEISNSDLTKFSEEGAASLREYKAKHLGSEPTPFMDLGTKVHSYILEPNQFKEQYACCAELPGPKMAKFIEYLTNNDSDDLDRIHKEAYNYAGFSISLTKVLTDLKQPENQLYYQHMLTNKGKTLLSFEDMKICSDVHKVLLDNRYASKYLNLDEMFDGTNVKTFTELEVYWPFLIDNTDVDDIGLPTEVKCKSKIDKVVVDWDSKKVTVVDFKTTSKPIRAFIENYKTYRIYRQLAFYLDAIKWYLNSTSNLDTSEWKYEAIIVAVTVRDPIVCKVFKPLPIDLEMGKEEYSSILRKLSKHIISGDWTDEATVENISAFLPTMSQPIE